MLRKSMLIGSLLELVYKLMIVLIYFKDKVANFNQLCVGTVGVSQFSKSSIQLHFQFWGLGSIRFSIFTLIFLKAQVAMPFLD